MAIRLTRVTRAGRARALGPFSVLYFPLRHHRRLQQTSPQSQQTIAANLAAIATDDCGKPRRNRNSNRNSSSAVSLRRRNAAHDSAHSHKDVSSISEEQQLVRLRTYIPPVPGTQHAYSCAYVAHKGVVEEHTCVYSPAAQQAAEAMISACCQKS